MPVHTGQFKFWCEHCQRGFLRKDRYEDHKRTKHGSGLLECEHCSKSFRSHYMLKQHLTEHEEEEQKGEGSVYMCVWCNKGFDSKLEVEKHAQTCL